MVEQIGVRAVLLVEDIRERKKFFVRVEERFLDALEAHLAGAEIFLDAEGNEGCFKRFLIEAVITERVDQLDEMAHLAWINNAEAVDVPAHRIAGFGHPPVVVFAESYDAPIESGNSF